VAKKLVIRKERGVFQLPDRMFREYVIRRAWNGIPVIILILATDKHGQTRIKEKNKNSFFCKKSVFVRVRPWQKNFFWLKTGQPKKRSLLW
jgi:hypothetical protein